MITHKTVHKKLISILLGASLILGAAPAAVAATPNVLPDLSGLEQLPPLPQQDTPDIAAMQDVSGGFASRSVERTELPSIPEDAVLLSEGMATRSLPNAATVGDKQEFYNLDVEDGSKIEAQVAAIGEHCRVYIDTEVSTYLEFAPSGTTPHENAEELADEFDAMYEFIVGKFGEPDLSSFQDVNPSGTINILLYDVQGDEDSGENFYWGGFFSADDFYQDSPGVPSNEDAVLYMDMDANHGYYETYSDAFDDFGLQYLLSTMAHEFQHLNTYSQTIRHALSGSGYPEGDPEAELSIVNNPISLWLNEGLSTLAASIYLGQYDLYNYGTLDFFVDNIFSPDVGYVPDTNEWTGNAGNEPILANYGVAEYLLTAYERYGYSIAELLDDPMTGYYGSLKMLDAQTGDFDAFFERALLDWNVATPGDSIAAIEAAGYTAAFNPLYDNIWRRGMNGVTSLSETQTVDMGNRRYYSQLYLADPIGAGNSAITLTTPDDSAMRYYVITPFNATSINTRDTWNTAAKIYGKLEPGENTVQVGTDNMFAVLAISFMDEVGSETISYEVRQQGGEPPDEPSEPDEEPTDPPTESTKPPYRPRPRPRPDYSDDDDDDYYYRPDRDRTVNSPTIPLPPPETWITSASAKVSGQSTGKSGVRASAWASLPANYYHDAMAANAVQVRVYIDEPSLFTKDAYLSGWVSGAEVSNTRVTFEKWFQNKIRVLHFDQSGVWERPVKVAAKIDLAGMDTTQLYFYAFDPKANSYRRIEATDYWIDANGYLRFQTGYAGEIIISEGELAKR